MENYKKSQIRELDVSLTLPNFIVSLTTTPAIVTMNVKSGTKMRNVLDYALKAAEKDEVRHVIWLGEGEATVKVTGCAEIMKRQCQAMTQQTNVLGYRRTEEIWDPVVPGLDKLKVNKDIPVLAIILSKDAANVENEKIAVAFQPVDSNFQEFWKAKVDAITKNLKRPTIGSGPIDQSVESSTARRSKPSPKA